MIAHAVFYDRRDNYCKRCEHWRGVCLRGHVLQSPTGCPLRRFPPVQGADYAQDKPRNEPAPMVLSDCCGKVTAELPDLSWAEVLKQFAEAMIRWKAAGFPLVNDEVHKERQAICHTCDDRKKKFFCGRCRCLVYLKAKVATETCPHPEKKWKR